MLNGGGGGASGHKGPISPPISDTKIADSKTKINDYLQGVLSEDINQRDDETIDKRKDEILHVIQDEFGNDGESFEISQGGSYSKHTYVDGLSDVDILINLGNYSDSNFPDKENSKAVLAAVAERLRRRYPNTQISVGKMAVTLTFSDGIEIQVLPAFSYYTGHKIPDPDSKGWVTSNPNRFKDKLTRVNQDNNNNVKPVIKLTKYIIDKNGIPIKSYHLENIALEAFSNYNGPNTKSDMVKHLLNIAKYRVLSKMEDTSGQSDYADEYLGDNRSDARVKLSDKIAKVYDNLKNAKTKEEWEKIVNGQ